MEDRLERLERLVEVLIERVEELSELLRVAVRQGVLKVRRGSSKKGLGVRDLSEMELEILERFFEWARGKWSEWKVSYEEGKLEGYDRERGWILLRKGTMNEYLDGVGDLSSRQEVLGLLGDLGILKYWEGRGGKRQYCIAVRITKPMRGDRMSSGYYVIDFRRMQEVSQELRSLLGAEVGINGVAEGV